MSDDGNEDQKPSDPSTVSVFVQYADSYIGRHIVSTLQEAGYTVYGDLQPKQKYPAPDFDVIPQFEQVDTISDVYHLCNTFIFDIRMDVETAMNSFTRFETATTPVTVILVSTLMTWALTRSSSPLTGDDFRKRKPHPGFVPQYEVELCASRLCRANPLVELYVVSVGVVYGGGEDVLFPFMKWAWAKQFNDTLDVFDIAHGLPLIGEGENIVPMIHVSDLASLVLATLQKKMIDRFVMAVDKGNHKLSEIIEAISKTFSNGQIQQFKKDESLIVPWLKETTIDYLTANINAVNELLSRVQMKYSSGFITSLDTVVQEFIHIRGVDPLRILVCGPPFSGKSYVAQKIAYRYSLPLITPESLLVDAKKNTDGHYQQFTQQLQGEISPNLLLELMKCKMQEVSSRNQGFVLDGIPSNYDFADALWSDGVPSPQIFVELEANDAFLRQRASEDPSLALGIVNMDDFEMRLNQYRATNAADDGHLFFALDPLTVRAVSIDVEKTPDIMTTIAKFIGRAHNFGKAPSLIIKDSRDLANAKKVKQERLEQIEREKREAEEAKRREKELQIARQQAAIQEEETRLLAKFSRAQREWLIETVAPILADGLWYLIGEMPEDPIQMLGWFIGVALPPEQREELMAQFQPEEEEEEDQEEEEEDLQPTTENGE